MFIFREVLNGGLQEANYHLGENFTIVNNDTNIDQDYSLFDSICKKVYGNTFSNLDPKPNIYAFVLDEHQNPHPIYVGALNYILNKDGKTFYKIRNRNTEPPSL